MKCIIRESNARRELLITDPQTGIDYTEDFIGNAGDLDNFVWDYDLDAYMVSAEVYSWWARVLEDQQALEDRLYELRQKHGSDAVEAVIGDMPYVDLEDHAAVLHRMLDDAFEDDNLDPDGIPG